MIALDISAVIELIMGTGKGKNIQELLTNEVGAISAITIHELLAGASDARVNFLKIFLKSLEVLPFDALESYKSSELIKLLKKKGKSIGDLDVLIAATCMVHEIPIITTDSDFTHVDRLKVILV